MLAPAPHMGNSLSEPFPQRIANNKLKVGIVLFTDGLCVKATCRGCFSFLAKYVRKTGTRCTSHVRKWEQAAAHLYYWACNFDYLYHFFLFYLEIAVLALSDSALVLLIFAEPLTVVTGKVSNSKPALYINYQSHQKKLKNNQKWKNMRKSSWQGHSRPTTASKPAIQVCRENGKRQGRRKLPLPFLLSIASSITAYC